MTDSSRSATPFIPVIFPDDDAKTARFNGLPLEIPKAFSSPPNRPEAEAFLRRWRASIVARLKKKKKRVEFWESRSGSLLQFAMRNEA